MIRCGATTVVGAGTGAVAGAGAGETLKERLGLGALGAVFGGAFGGMVYTSTPLQAVAYNLRGAFQLYQTHNWRMASA